MSEGKVIFLDDNEISKREDTILYVSGYTNIDVRIINDVPNKELKIILCDNNGYPYGTSDSAYVTSNVGVHNANLLAPDLGPHIVRIQIERGGSYRLGVYVSGFFNSTSDRAVNTILNLRKLEINRGTQFNSRAFRSASNLEEVIINSDLEHIFTDTRVFQICANLKKVDARKSINLTSINDFTFSWCGSLEEILIPDSVYIIGGSCFGGTKWLSDQENGLVYIGKVLLTYKGEMEKNTSIIVDSDIKGLASNAFVNQKHLVSVELPDTLKRIGAGAFSDVSEISKIIVPETIESIGIVAFRRCSRLTEFRSLSTTPFILDSVTVFQNSQDVDIFVPDESVNSYKTATNWSVMESRIFPMSQLYETILIWDVPSPGQSIELRLNNLDSNNLSVFLLNSQGQIIDTKVTSNAGAWNPVLVAPTSTIHTIKITCDGLYEIGSNTVNGVNNSGITSLELGIGVRGVRLNSPLLTNLIISETVEEIFRNGFVNSKIENLKFRGDSQLKLINSWGFQSNRTLTEVTIPNSLTEISQEGFKGCIGLTTVNFGINSKLEYINSSAFEGASKLVNFTLPNSLRRIGFDAFRSCHDIEYLPLPEGLDEIYPRGFYYCQNLKQVRLPSTLNTIGNNVFTRCEQLEVVIVDNPIPPSIGSQVFAFNSVVPPDLRIYVPHESVDLYKAISNWFPSRIRSINELPTSGIFI